MCQKKLILSLAVLSLCSALFALPQFSSSRDLQPTEATIPAVQVQAEQEREAPSEGSQIQQREEPTASRRGFLPFLHREAVADLEAINDLQMTVIEERDAQLDAIERKATSIRPVIGIGAYTRPYAEEPTVGLNGVIGLRKGNWSLLAGAGYADMKSLDDPKKADAMMQLMLIKAF